MFMKAISVLLSIIAAGFVSASPGFGQMSPYSFAKSPDHPSTWVAGASNIRQVLRWDPSKQMLVADVRYSTRDWADSVHPANESDYTLTFPTVQLDRASGTLEASGRPIGKVSSGLFGTNVHLSQKAELDVHRHHGRIFAAINPVVTP